MYCQNQLTDNLNSLYTVHPKVYCFKKVNCQYFQTFSMATKTTLNIYVPKSKPINMCTVFICVYSELHHNYFFQIQLRIWSRSIQRKICVILVFNRRSSAFNILSWCICCVLLQQRSISIRRIFQKKPRDVYTAQLEKVILFSIFFLCSFANSRVLNAHVFFTCECGTASLDGKQMRSGVHHMYITHITAYIHAAAAYVEHMHRIRT